MKHRIVNRLHVIEVDGRINVYDEEEYTQLTWWNKVKIKFNLNNN